MKAVIAFVSTASSGLLAALLLGSDGGKAVTAFEIISIVSSTIVVTLGVFLVPNRPAKDAAAR